MRGIVFGRHVVKASGDVAGDNASQAYGTVACYDHGHRAVELSLGDQIRAQPVNLQALDDLHPLLLTPRALHDPANVWCLPPGVVVLLRHSKVAAVVRGKWSP